MSPPSRAPPPPPRQQSAESEDAELGAPPTAAATAATQQPNGPPHGNTASSTTTTAASNAPLIENGRMMVSPPATAQTHHSAHNHHRKSTFGNTQLHASRMSSRRCILLSFYSLSIVLSMLLFFFAGIYCQLGRCTITWTERNRQYAQASPIRPLFSNAHFHTIFPMVVSCLTLFLSAAWLISNSCYLDSPCMHEYNCLEMPTAVFCSLMAGICAVIEIHYSFDYSYLYWSEKWTFAAADAVAMVFLHAAIAFALT